MTGRVEWSGKTYNTCGLGIACPITGTKYEHPVLCIEDGGVYEKDAIKKWFETSMQNYRDGIRITAYPAVKSPVTGVALKVLTLVPMKQERGSDFFQFIGGDPEVLKADGVPSTGNTRCIRDERIRSILLQVSQSRASSNYEEYKKHAKAFAERRTELGLEVCENRLAFSPDLSNLDFSGMQIERLDFKWRCLAHANLKGTHFVDCKFERVGIFYCNLQDAKFQNCSFQGESTSFHGSDVLGAEFTLEKALESSEPPIKLIETWSGFKEELKKRGAINADGIHPFGCKPRAAPAPAPVREPAPLPPIVQGIAWAVALAGRWFSIGS